eukprot:CAMPEP_0198213368 /NCGR_PEP_ID=MMETSP1445-20131203/28823_1 /TAXON_ID=36898 /ORGANISM="Pyramimonas sp., Strain CCMP2087" /LENGTH=87 /DNA_ID=CAMNT_0043887995 /DNA_START=255 /DNA_END=519 /DNA_ORIENTATION=+
MAHPWNLKTHRTSESERVTQIGTTLRGDRFTNTAAQNLMDRGWTADLPDVPFPPLDTYQGNLGRWDTPNGIGEPLPKIRFTTLEEFK